jgi:ABC-2 type transport system permease protein
MSAFVTHFSFEFKTGVRNKNLLLMNYLFPLGFYLMMGFIMPAVNPTFRDAMVPAMVTFAVLASTMLGLPDPLVSARENGIFRSYRINGVPAVSILSIAGLTTGLHLAVASLIIIVSAPVLFGAPAPENVLYMAITLVALWVASSGLGLLIGVISPSTRMTIMVSQAIFVPSMLLGGLMMPFSFLPEAAQHVARLLPASQAMNAFNGLAMGGTADFNPWGSIVAMLASGFLAFGLALYLFSWDSKNNTRRGRPALALLALVPYVVGIVLNL